ncbi:hypothetical protein H4V99_001487 [Cryobacterium sp. CG_9.6]|nr:hypothetical protein [Cryobacterium sp. CG_9.6]
MLRSPLSQPNWTVPFSVSARLFGHTAPRVDYGFTRIPATATRLTHS